MQKVNTTNSGRIAIEPPSLEACTDRGIVDQIDECVATLRGLLAKMHPAAKVRSSHVFGNGQDQSIILSVNYPYQPPKGVPVRDLLARMEGREA